MIVTFIMFYNYVTSLLNYYCNRKNITRDDDWPCVFELPTDDGGTFIVEDNIIFSPPLYKRRYNIVAKILQIVSNNFNGKRLKVVDFGCSEYGFLGIVKETTFIQEYIGVDIDVDTLKRFYTRLTPTTYDYLKPRRDSLSVKILTGCVTKHDVRLQNCNAVIAIELIEHLYPNVLEEIPFSIFGIIQPEIVIITTPNSEFNVLFNLKGFRHSDHKFEWTRKQFRAWANNLVVRYPNYKVKFGGVGLTPNGYFECMGYCTQIAVFFRSKHKFDTSSKFVEVYNLFFEVEFPFRTLKQDLPYIVYNATLDLILHTKGGIRIDEEVVEIPLRELSDYLFLKYSCTKEQMRNILTSYGYTVNTLEDGSLVLMHYSNATESDCYSNEDDDPDEYYCTSLPLEDKSEKQIAIVEEEEEDWGVMDSQSNGKEETKDDEAASCGPDHYLCSQHATVANGTSLESQHHINGVDRISSRPIMQWREEEEEARSSSSSGQNDHFIKSSQLKHNSKHEQTGDKVEYEHTPLQKSHSLEDIYTDRTQSKTFRSSLNIDKCKFIDFEIANTKSNGIHKDVTTHSISADTFAPRQEDSCSQSRAVDSGYPNSYGQDMDMDLTPEQVDEIITESESSFDGDVEDESVEYDEPLDMEAHGGEIVRLGENVENGDVANNNRDGEGNNMEAVAAGGILQFEQVIEENEIAVGNLAAAVIQESDEDLGFSSIGDVHSIVELHTSCENLEQIQDEYIPVIDVQFPGWLLRMLADEVDDINEDEDDDAAGDANTLRIQVQVEFDGVGGNNSHLENDDNIDVESVFSDVEQLSDIELLDEPPVELIVDGDIMGGGEPAPPSND